MKEYKQLGIGTLLLALNEITAFQSLLFIS
jgi:hypothetical protein